MPSNGRKFVRIVKFLLAGVTIFCVSWIASVSEWHAGVRWTSRGDQAGTTMKTIVAYSEQKQAEMDRPMPVACDRLPVFPKLLNIVSIFYFYCLIIFIRLFFIMDGFDTLSIINNLL